MRLAARWASAALLALAATLALGALGLPGPAMFGGLAAGILAAAAPARPLELPQPVRLAAQGAAGVLAGSLLTPDTVAAIGDAVVPIAAVSVVTVAVSIALGQLLRLGPGVSSETASFSMIAGGAAGVIVIARELGADDRVVAVVQYLRVLIVVLLMPLVVGLPFVHTSAAGTPLPGGEVPPVAGAAYTGAVIAAGIAAARRIAMTTPSLFGPLLLAAALAVTGLVPAEPVPGAVQQLSLGVIGLQVGLGFRRDVIVPMLRLLPLAILLILAVILVCAGLAFALAAAADVPLIDAYLATTPGGMYAVIGLAPGVGADAAFVVTVQVARLFLVLGTAPLLARVLRRRRAASG